MAEFNLPTEEKRVSTILYLTHIGFLIKHQGRRRHADTLLRHPPRRALRRRGAPRRAARPPRGSRTRCPALLGTCRARRLHRPVRHPRRRRGEDGGQGRRLRQAAPGLRPRAARRAGQAQEARRRRVLPGSPPGEFRHQDKERRIITTGSSRPWFRCLARVQVARGLQQGRRRRYPRQARRHRRRAEPRRVAHHGRRIPGRRLDGLRAHHLPARRRPRPRLPQPRRQSLPQIQAADRGAGAVPGVPGAAAVGAGVRRAASDARPAEEEEEEQPAVSPVHAHGAQAPRQHHQGRLRWPAGDRHPAVPRGQEEQPAGRAPAAPVGFAERDHRRHGRRGLRRRRHRSSERARVLRAGQVAAADARVHGAGAAQRGAHRRLRGCGDRGLAGGARGVPEEGALPAARLLGRDAHQDTAVGMGRAARRGPEVGLGVGDAQRGAVWFHRRSGTDRTAGGEGGSELGRVPQGPAGATASGEDGEVHRHHGGDKGPRRPAGVLGGNRREALRGRRQDRTQSQVLSTRLCARGRRCLRLSAV